MYSSRNNPQPSWPKRGVVLVMALWLVTIMAIFGVGLARISWSGYRFAKLEADRIISLNAVDALIATIKLDLTYDATSSYDDLSEFPTEAEYEYAGIKFVYSMTDEESYVNINNATGSVLENLPDMNKRKATAIKQFEHRPFGAKEELLLIDEIDEEDYTLFKDLITIHGSGGVNINTCSKEILEVLGMKKRLITNIMNFRKGNDNESDTADDGVFKSMDTIIDDIKNEFFLSLKEEQDLISLVSTGIFSVGSDNRRIEADVYSSGRVIDKYSFVLGRKAKGTKYYIKEWSQH